MQNIRGEGERKWKGESKKGNEVWRDTCRK